MRRLGRVLAAVLLVVVGAGALPDAAGGQQTDNENEVRIVARRLADGRVEFGLQERAASSAWGERRLPSVRFFPTGAQVGRWLSSSPLTLGGGVAADSAVRIVARRLADGRVEFGLQERAASGAWGERRLPSVRFFPTGAQVGRWLSSSPLPLTGARPPSGSFSIADGPRSGDTLIAASFDRTCTVRSDGGVTCWGSDRLVDQLSTATLNDVEAISIGDSSEGHFHACVLHTDHTVSCWGPGFLGQLGQGDEASHVLPVRVPGIGDVIALAAGSAHTCAAHGDGGVSCWGYGAEGQIGDGTTGTALTPKRVPGLTDIVALSSGNVSTCGVHADGSVSCWGWGFGSTPRRIRGLARVTSVAIGWTYSCAVTVDGHVYCWPFQTTVRPRRIDGLNDVVALSVGDRSVCVLHRNGGVSCFGENNSAGQIGDGTTSARLTPRRVAGVADAVDITVTVPSVDGEAHACALHGDGTVSCWGTNGFGQLGDGTTRTRLAPTRVQRHRTVRTPADLTDRTNLLRAWIDLVVAELEDDSPWLRAAWDHIRDETSVTLDLFGLSAAPFRCGVSGGVYTCRGERLDISTANLDHPSILEVVVHELAHVYDLTTGLAAGRPWGAAQLYFTDTYPDCPLVPDLQGVGRELLADTMRVLTIPPTWLGYGYFGALECPNVPDRPTREAQQVVLAALGGEVPAWYTKNITGGAELWTALRKDPELHALANLADEFGGLCRTDWITYPIDRARIPPAGSNPFRDGGC